MVKISCDSNSSKNKKSGGNLVFNKSKKTPRNLRSVDLKRDALNLFSIFKILEKIRIRF